MTTSGLRIHRFDDSGKVVVMLLARVHSSAARAVLVGMLRE